MKVSWKGIFVATVTPLKNGTVDVAGFQRLIDHLVSGGVHGLCPAGTTGEGWSLTDEEFRRVVEMALRSVDGKIPVIPGTGTFDTEKTIRRTQLAKELGADGALVVTPYYVKPTQTGLEAHYRKVAQEGGLPIVLYNVPGRTGVNMLPETVARLAGEPNIVAVKECAPFAQVKELFRLTAGKLTWFSGEDGECLPFLEAGGHGVVSVAANVVPKEMTAMYASFVSGDLETARDQFEILKPLMEAFFCEPNPIPVKAALAEMGLIGSEIRLPLTPLSAGNLPRLREEMSKLNLGRKS